MADTRAPLFTQHGRALVTLFAEIETYALSQREVFTGTAGGVIERTNAAGFRFYAHQFYDGEGHKRERYVAGPIGRPEADAAATQLQVRIDDLKTLVPSLRLLGREGFQIADARTFATVASLHNAELFAAGAMLIGSHAYGVVLNRLGVRAAAYSTEDIDIARGEKLAFEERPESSFLEMLCDSGIEFVEVPQLSRKEPPTSYKKRGRSTFQVDLLVPSRDESYRTLPVPELQAHATALPYLDYLVAESQMGALLAREGCCVVRVPLPERFALHKLIVSTLRRARDAKAAKDRAQAAVLCAALAEIQPGALESAAAKVPRRARPHLHRALESIRDVLEDRHPRVWEELTI